MTTTIVFAGGSNVYLFSGNASYATARTGSALGTSAAGTTVFFGQRFSGSSYTLWQAFLRFAWTLPAGERVTSASIRVKHSTIAGSSIGRDLELRSYDWGPAVDTADWRNPTILAAAPLWAVVRAANTATTSQYCYAGSDELLTALQASVTVNLVAVSSRQRAGTTPTTDEATSLRMDGTADAPALVVTSTAAYSQLRVLGAQVQLPDGTWAMLTAADGGTNPVITLNQVSATGVVTPIATVPTGSTATTFGLPAGAHALELVADPSGNLYVLGRLGNAENSLAVLRYTNGTGNTWTAGTLRSAALPAHSTTINLVAAAWHSVGAGGTVVACVRHTAGPGDAAASGVNHAVWALINGDYLATGAGALLRASGEGLGVFQPSDFDDFSMPANDTGTGLDVAATSATQGVVVSFDRHSALGENSTLSYTFYTLAADGAALASTISDSASSWGVKDAAARARAVRISDTEAVLATADEDPGWGITLNSLQRFGSGAVTRLGSARLDGETVTMPDPGALSRTALWDVVYSPVDGKVWVYYFDRNDPRRLLRTAFSLNTHLPTAETVQVAAAAVAAPATVKAIRVQRGAAAGLKTLVTVFAASGSGLPQNAYLIDSFNLPPTQPILTTRAAFDATAAAVFSWTFTDPNTGDTPSAYRLEIVNVSTGALTYDSGKVASTGSSHTLAAGTLANATSYQWRVSTWDAADAAGPASDYGSFTTSAGGTVTITNPAADNPAGVVEDAYTVQWTVVGTVQAAYRVRLVRQGDGVQISDTGFVTSTATSHTVTGMLSGVQYRVEVIVRNAAAVVSSTATRQITPDYGSPEAPQLTVTADSDDGFLLVQVTNPVPGSVNLGTTPATFDTDVAGWTPSGGTYTQSTAQAHRGAGSGLLTTVGTPAQTYVRPAVVPIVAGRRYTARGWIYSPTSRPVSIAIDWQGPGGYLSTASVQLTPPAGVWTEIAVIGTAPNDATGATYGPTIAADPANGTQLYVDDPILVDANDLPDVATNLIYRRVAGAALWRLLATVGPGGQFRDYTAAAGVAYEYRARGVT